MRTRNKTYEEPKLTTQTKTTIQQEKPSNQSTANPLLEKEDNWKEQLKSLYHNINFPGSFSSKIGEFIRTNETSSKFKPIRKKIFPRRRIIARFPSELFMADLFEYPLFKRINHGYVYGLIVIDCFSRKIYFKPLKKKDATSTATAIDQILSDLDEPPINFVTDAGKEFFNSNVNKVFESFGVVHYKPPTKTNWKASMAERAIRTIKSRLAKIFYKRKSNKWIDVIDKVIKNYNNSPHRAHGFKPVDVTDENREAVYKKLYPTQTMSVVCKLAVGDRVRKIREKSHFEKGYTQNWSDEIFVIETVQNDGVKCWYKLKTLNNDKVSGIFYYYQLNLVARDAPLSQRNSEESNN